MKIVIIGDPKTEKIEVVRRNSEEEAHLYYIKSKIHILKQLKEIANNKKLDIIDRHWIEETIKFIKEGEY